MSPPMIDRSHAAQFWHRVDKNVGDLVAAPLAEATLGVQTQWVRRKFKGKLLGLGSIARHVQDGDLLAGCGAIQDEEITLPATARVAWLRGPLTRRCLGDTRIPEVFGDPGLLLADVMPIKRTRSNRVGVIPHLVDRDTLQEARMHEDVSIIDVGEAVEDFVRAVCACEIVLSSSLHGIVFAEAYGVPALWLAPHPDMKGGRFKFDDYYLGTGRPIQKPLSLASGLEIARSGEAAPAELDLSQLRAAVEKTRRDLDESMN